MEIEWDPTRISSFADSMVCACAEAARNASATYFGMHFWGECFSLHPDKIIGEAGDCRLADGNYQNPHFCHENYDEISEHECLAIENYYLYEVVEEIGSSEVLRDQTVSALPQLFPLIIMGQWTRFPEENAKGEMFISSGMDIQLQPIDIITWENTIGHSGSYQWLGWQDQLFASKTLKYSFWIKFFDQIPAPSANFGMKVYGTVYNDFLQTCTKNTWCYVENTVLCAASGDTNYVILIFDSINHKQKVHISNLQLQILKDGSSDVMQTLSALPQTIRLKLMGQWSRFPVQYGHGEMHVGNVGDDKFQPEDIITWVNTVGTSDSYQWLGWQAQLFASKTLKYSFWIKFAGRVPVAAESSQLGMKVYGTVYNEFLQICTKDVWCYVEKTVVCAASGDGNHVILIFDSIDHQQTVHISKLQVQILKDGSSEVEQTLRALPQTFPLKLMGQWSRFPEHNAIGTVYISTVNDDRFQHKDIITWENTENNHGPYQWLGWQDKLFAGKTLKYSFWIKFVDQVPAASANFGMKVYGTVYNDFLNTCTKNTWCYVEKTVVCAASGDDNHVILIFDTINQKQTVHINRLQVQILEDGSHAVKQTLSALTHDLALKVMGKWSQLPVHNSLGKIYVGDVNDDTFQPNDIITWQNTAGHSGSFQWLGWQDQLFASKALKYSFWIKFADQVPAASANFGMKVYGMVYNNFVNTCTKDAWCYVEKTVVCAASGDDSHVILIFDSINHQQTVHISKLQIQILKDGSSEVEKTMYASPQVLRLKLMGRWGHFPEQYGAGKIYVGNGNDDTFHGGDMITWRNKGIAGPFQWLGWQNTCFAGKMLKFSFWIEFVDHVPAASVNFGMKVFGTVYNDFVKTCTNDVWCYVEKTVACATSGDGNRVILIFDSINHQQTVHITNFQVQVLEDGSRDVIKSLSALPQTIGLKLMGKWSCFPEHNDVGKIYVGDVADDTFPPEDIITWENTAGHSGSYQWLGWQDESFAGKTLKYSFWIKFVDQVPAASANFGMKVYGTVYNEFVNTCTKNAWCYVEKTVVCEASGDDYYVILIFDSIDNFQTVRISKLQVQILKGAR